MTRKIVLATILCGIAFISLPMRSYADSTVGEPSVSATTPLQRRWGKNKRGRRQGPKRYYGYKNYGQYRRTQVGNRRYRLVRRPYYRNGIRLTRWVRLYY
ncbi:MAG TPA: hypothetical protein VFZ23_06005 [Pyrinomonadaceae bacterium]